MPGSFRIGSIAGIDIFINVSWLIILVFLTFDLANSWFPTANPGFSTSTYLVLGFISAILLFVSVLLHELAHSLVARARGLPVKSIVLFIFGGVSNIEQEPERPGVEFQMAFVGPVVSLLIGAVCYVLSLPLRGVNSPLESLLLYLTVSNILLGVFNLLPGFPLDGGRVLRSIIWKITGNAQKATRIATFVGQALAYLIILWGIIQFFSGTAFAGLIIIFTGWFLLNAAQSARTQSTIESVFRGVTVGEVMSTNVVTVPANVSLQKLVDEYFLPHGLSSAFVMQADFLAGLITLAEIRHVPRDQWAQTPVGFAMIPIDRLHVLSPQQKLSEVLARLDSHEAGQLPVVQDGRLLGVLNRDAIMRSLAIRRSLGLYQDRAA
jgi:Zn-dependent protease/predicted transcriptional regulator